MANNKDGRVINPFQNFVGGIADFDKDGAPNTYAFGRSIDYRTNPRELTLLSETSKESGGIVTDLLKWPDRVSNTSYFYGNAGNFYQRTSTPTWSLLKTIPSSHGNGMAYFGEDDFIYYTSDKLIGRYGPIINGTPAFADDYFGSQGGIPTNTHSISLTAASSMYEDRADTASLSITGNMAAEAYVKFTSLPAVGSTMTLIGKWDESGALRSYKVDVAAVSGYFGDGSDGTKTIAADTVDAPIDSTCSGTISTTSLTATNVSFAANQVILIHQARGTGAGTWQRNTIQGYTAGTITLATPLNATYSGAAQVLVMKQYSAVTVNSGKIWSPKSWTATSVSSTNPTGGILAFLCSGTTTVTGTISANGTNVNYSVSDAQAFQGGAGTNGGGNSGPIAEGTGGPRSGAGTSNNGSGGGGGPGGGSSAGSSPHCGGAGGGNGTTGSTLGAAQVGTTSGSADLTTMTFGGGGGAGGKDNGTEGNKFAGSGGGGGGIIFISTVTLTVSGGITSNGAAGSDCDATSRGGGGGGGAGGSILIKCQTATLGTNLITATGGAGGGGGGGDDAGGAGGFGRIHMDYLTSYTGSTSSPGVDVAQDNSLVTTTTYQLRFSVSNDGTAFENLSKNITNLMTGAWTRLGISWVASTSTVTFYQDGTSFGTFVGTKTAIHDNTSRLYVGANKGASAVGNFLNGKLDDVRIWNTVRSDSQMLVNKDVELAGTETGLVAYYKFNNAHTDSTANANTLTANNAPTFSTDVPFPNPTTRLDIDQSASTSSQTYTTPLTISESSTDRKTFIPAKDPQKSLDVLFAAKGTGNVTVTVHDALNREIASATITTANMVVGYNEFTWSTAWRPIIGATYHFHVTSTVADSTVTTGTVSDLSTVSFHTYYQFLVTDSDYHPITRFLNLIVIGNERYVATYDASTYVPHKLKLPSGYKVRCFTQWREYLAIGCWRGTNIYDYDDGIIFFWDGYSTTYNFYITVPEGGINAMVASKGILNVWAGYQGDIITYVGGDSAEKLRRIPKITKDKYVEVMPGAVAVWQSLIRFGVAGNSDSTAIERGVYTLGQATKDYPTSLSYDYPISTGNRTASNIKVGMIFPLDRKLLVGWQDNTAFGVDVIDPAGSPFSTGTIERLIDDSGKMYTTKYAQTVRADFKTLNSGESITLKYKLDRATTWTSGTPVTSGDFARLTIPVQDHKEVQIAADLATSVSTAPTLLSLALDKDLDQGSEDF